MKYCFNFVLFVLCVLHYFRTVNESPGIKNEWGICVKQSHFPPHRLEYTHIACIRGKSFYFPSPLGSWAEASKRHIKHKFLASIRFVNVEQLLWCIPSPLAQPSTEVKRAEKLFPFNPFKCSWMRVCTISVLSRKQIRMNFTANANGTSAICCNLYSLFLAGFSLALLYEFLASLHSARPLNVLRHEFNYNQ